MCVEGGKFKATMDSGCLSLLCMYAYSHREPVGGAPMCGNRCTERGMTIHRQRVASPEHTAPQRHGM